MDQSLLSFADYGAAIFAIACIAFIVYVFVTNGKKDKQDVKEESKPDLLLEIIKSNAEVVRNNTEAMNELKTLMQVSYARIEAKVDELLRR